MNGKPVGACWIWIFIDLARYHGKCLKIARGKVKDVDKYTCPICDWRVKIPRDAARPKLEDLQEWQAEIPNLPFQPDEEELLDKIIKQASAFREFLQGLTNAACTTSEEVPTMLFYLRKIEGAEVLLADETNFFRQELHKWAPVAPEPPPILEQSLSTRKPRPTKQQKIMAQLGVDRVEDIPPHLRPKNMNAKRKSQDPSQATRPAPAPSTRPGPAPAGRDDRGEPASIQPDSNSLPYLASENYPNPNLNSRRGSTASLNLRSTPELPFLPTSTQSPTLPAARREDPTLFNQPSGFDRGGQTEATAAAAPTVDVDTNNPFGGSSSPARHNMGDVFADLTNEDADPVAPMENTHANEALEALSASNDNDAGEQGAEETQANMDSTPVEEGRRQESDDEEL